MASGAISCCNACGPRDGFSIEVEFRVGRDNLGASVGESLGLNRARYVDVLMTLTENEPGGGAKPLRGSEIVYEGRQEQGLVCAA